MLPRGNKSSKPKRYKQTKAQRQEAGDTKANGRSLRSVVNLNLLGKGIL